MRVSSIVSVFALIGVVGSSALSSSCSSKASGGSDGGTSSSSGGPPPCMQFTDNASLTSPTVSFKNDVLPFFQFSCGISSSCHGGTPATDIMQRGLFLGCSGSQIEGGTCGATTQDDEAAQVYGGLVGATANMPIEESCMPFVKAGDPTMSYLMHKLDGDQSCTVSCCTPNNMAVASNEGTQGTALNGPDWCGASMPYQQNLQAAGPVCGGTMDCTQPAAFSRDTVRAWIAQGAMNN